MQTMSLPRWASPEPLEPGPLREAIETAIAEWVSENGDLAPRYERGQFGFCRDSAEKCKTGHEAHNMFVAAAIKVLGTNLDILKYFKPLDDGGEQEHVAFRVKRDA